MKPSLALALICLPALLAACATPSGAAPTLPPTPATTSSPGGPTITVPPPTPQLHAGFQDVTLIPGRLAGDWAVIGLLANPSANAISNLGLDVSLLDEGGRMLAHQVVRPVLETIGPGAQSPFEAHFVGAGAASQPRVEVVAYRLADQAPAQVDIDQLEPRAMEAGRMAVYGRVTNGDQEPVVIENLALLAVSPTGRAIALSDSVHGLSVLDPGDTAPFVAVLETSDPAVILRAYSWARFVPDAGQSPLSFSIPPRIEVDAGGSPLVLGTVRNDSGDWMTADIVVSLRQGGQLLGIAELELPWPLAPGESQPFLADEFPGLGQRVQGQALDPEGLSVETQVDPAGSRTTASAPVSLEASVTSQQVVRGSLFLRGTLSNGASERVERPAAMAALRSTDGEVLSAGFVIAGTVLEAGGKLPFVLTLHLPRDIDLSMAEFDLRAGGSLPE